MPRTGIILRVFVASPSDVAEERVVLEEIIRELNITWSRTLGIYLELVKWETHAFPGVGPDPQAIINEQLADDYDIFIGIMWTRFGTPTGRAGSGTAEEFYRARERYQESPNLVRIMFYFKNAPISPSDLDPEQLTLLRSFQKDLGEKGTLYWTYTNRDEFTQLVRMHLSRQVQEWGKTWGIESDKHIEESRGEDLAALAATESELGDEGTEDEEEGFLDLLETGQDRIEAMNEGVNRMANALQTLGQRISERTEELNHAKTPTGTVDVKQAKRISNRVAEEMNNFAALMEAEVPLFANSYSEGMEAYTHAFTLTDEMGATDKDDINLAYNTIEQFKNTLSETRTHMKEFRQTIAALPRATTVLNKAKRRVVSIMDKFDEEITTASNLTLEVEKTLAKLLGD